MSQHVTHDWLAFVVDEGQPAAARGRIVHERGRWYVRHEQNMAVVDGAHPASDVEFDVLPDAVAHSIDPGLLLPGRADLEAQGLWQGWRIRLDRLRPAPSIPEPSVSSQLDDHARGVWTSRLLARGDAERALLESGVLLALCIPGPAAGPTRVTAASDRGRRGGG